MFAHSNVICKEQVEVCSGEGDPHPHPKQCSVHKRGEEETLVGGDECQG